MINEEKMISVEGLSYGVPTKELYEDISFSIEIGCHCALIGSNGTGKSTLVDMIIDTDEYLFDGKIVKDPSCRIGYANQFSVRDKLQDITVFEFLSEKFLKVADDLAAACDEMSTSDDMEAAFEKYQKILDLNDAMDGDNYESNIKKQLNLAGMASLASTPLSQISGGEYKLLQIMREMLFAPNLLILDEPDVFLDFGNLNSLCQLINGYKGTLLVVTHNRYLLNHCFNKILHLENGDLQEFDGSYTEYRCSILREKLVLKAQNLEEQEEIARTQRMVDIYRKKATLLVNPTFGRAVNAKQTQLDRLRARQIKAPFIEVREPEILLPEVDFGSVCGEPGAEAFDMPADPKVILSIDNYQVDFDKDLLQNVSFDIKQGEKVAIVGANGTGKTTLMRDILENSNPAITIDTDTPYAFLSQLQGENIDEDKTVYQVMQDHGFGDRPSIKAYLSKFCLEPDLIDHRVKDLSGGEQNLLQIALITNSNAEFLILDEPTSHLDLYAQIALENAIADYKGTVLMVSHDFYLVANCADYVLLVDDNTVRRIRSRKFRKMVYDKYFDSSYLEKDKKKQELEAAITTAFTKNDLETVDKLCDELEALSL